MGKVADPTTQRAEQSIASTRFAASQILLLGYHQPEIPMLT